MEFGEFLLAALVLAGYPSIPALAPPKIQDDPSYPSGAKDPAFRLSAEELLELGPQFYSQLGIPQGWVQNPPIEKDIRRENAQTMGLAIFWDIFGTSICHIMPTTYDNQPQ